ncbi:hypothetical protein NUW58_g6331 [Xylaria curta]|uniref:Uncharacterized protein n=1 Tax=Xylaria curta TaxID=42375 RepID=A0ACC1NX35_9PEZI|nr:hypothetical protein NUW58_g6331 [Xylaria curta]
MAETKLSLASDQLSEQVKECKKLWRKFRDEYTAEVKNVKLYAGTDILQQIWKKKVEHTSKCKHGDNEDNQEFTIQSMKLESCLSQVDEATELLAQARSSGYSSQYDSRQHHLEKMRATGKLVVGLSKSAVTNEAACVDLLGELAELEKLISSKSSTASMSHDSDKRQSQKPARSGKEKAQGFSSNRPDNGEMERQTEHNSNDYHNGQDNSDDFQVITEQIETYDT